MDITEPEQIENAFQTVRKDHGQLDVLVNCAGTARTHVTYNFNKKGAVQLEHFKTCINVCFLFTNKNSKTQSANL